LPCRNDSVVDAGHGKKNEGAARQPRELLGEEIELPFANGAPQVEQTQTKANRR
jgi:hypothetical protein